MPLSFLRILNRDTFKVSHITIVQGQDMKVKTACK